MGKRRISPFRDAKACVCGSHGFVGLNRGMTALFDVEHVDLIGRSNWSMLNCKGGPYARSQSKRLTNQLMHRALTGVPTGMVVDHKNHDTLDNRSPNLRVCTQEQNLWNQRGSKRSLPKGVYPTPSGRYVSQISRGGRRETLGPFDTPEQAGAAYAARSKTLHGEFAQAGQKG